MSIVSKLKKNELKLVAEKIGLTVPGDAKMIDLNRLIEDSDVFKENYEFVKYVIEQVLEEVKPQKSQLNGEIELERLKLERVKAELKLAKLRSSANNSETSLNGGETEASIDFDTLKEPIVSDKMFQTIVGKQQHILILDNPVIGLDRYNWVRSVIYILLQVVSP
ncbi:uncharacterized protein TNCT_543561 [Trichonephila clavata]|uniref:Uncharacterized protein n=1 Tax=Trichonephila clavata TaxID=2740835 RepID=A0A8X6GVD3_TRICU|nr:uncharacterized protein TNCT_543561 [Trichonephila clavata]